MKKFIGDKSYITAINNQGIEEYKNAIKLLNAQCKDFTVGDIVYKRVQCNLAINTSVSRLVASQQIALKIAKDVFAVAKAYPQDAKDLLGYNESVDSYEVLDKQFKTQIKEILEAYQSTIGNGGYFNAFDGLSATLLANMKAVGCYDKATQVPAISKWVKESNASTEYLETNCKVGNDFGDSSASGPAVKARYFRKIDGKSSGSDDVANVMGVLIEREKALNRDGGWDSRTKAEDLVNRNFVFNQSASVPKPGFIAINNKLYDENATGPIVVPVRDISTGGNIPTGGSTITLVKISDSADPSIWPKSYSTWTFATGGYRTGTLMRVTDAQGYSYVFVNQNYGQSSNGADQRTLSCVSADCSVQNWQVGGALNFKLGPQEVWLSQHGSYSGAGYPYGLSVNKEFYGWKVN